MKPRKVHTFETNEPPREKPLTNFYDLPIGTLFVVEGRDSYYSGQLCIRSHQSVVILSNGDRWEFKSRDGAPNLPIRVLPEGTLVTLTVGDSRK